MKAGTWLYIHYMYILDWAPVLLGYHLAPLLGLVFCKHERDPKKVRAASLLELWLIVKGWKKTLFKMITTTNNDNDSALQGLARIWRRVWKNWRDLLSLISQWNQSVTTCVKNVIEIKYIHTYIYIYIYIYTHTPAQSPGAVKYIDCISAEELNSPNRCPGYDVKPSDGEAPVLELWGMWSTPSLLLLPCPLWTRVPAPMSQIELLDI